NSDAVKTSAGALSHIPVARERNLIKAIDFLKDSGLQIVAATEKTDHGLYTVDFTIPTAIIMGSEEDGVSPAYLKKSDKLVKIPMKGKTESLNVSVAAAVLIYEAVRQRVGVE
nr:RNA methyltransferase [Bacteroidota bacterium]